MPIDKKTVAKKNTTRKSKNKYLAKKVKKSLKKGKKLSKKVVKKNRKKKSKGKKKKPKPVLINGGGGCGCGSSPSSSSFKSYMSELKGSLLDGQSGGGYSINPESVIAGHKSEVVPYNDLEPPVLVNNKLVQANCRQ
tara:strand:+ start:237 stop:647 length:411 start_codon:yes stop_codon:yes gene_type:complete